MRRPLGLAISLVLLVLFARIPAGAIEQTVHPRITTLSIHDESVREVIQALAERFGLSVVIDETVDGTVSLVLQETSAQEALHEIAGAAGLFVADRQGIYYLSRLRFDESDRGWTVESRCAPLATLIQHLSAGAGITVSHPYDLPQCYSCSLGPAPVGEILAAIAGDLSLSLTGTPGRYVLSEPDPVGAVRSVSSGETTVDFVRIPESGELSIAARQAGIIPVLSVIADTLGMVVDSSPIPERETTITSLRAPDLETLLEILGRRYEVEILSSGGVLAIAPLGRLELLEPYLRHEAIALRRASVSAAVSALNQITGIEIEFVDQQRNAVSIRGVPRRVEYALAVLERLEETPDGRATAEFTLVHQAPSTLAPLLRDRFPDSSVIPIDDRSALLVTVPAATATEVESFVAALDSATQRESLRCRFIPPGEAAQTISMVCPTLTVIPSADGRHLTVEGPQGEIHHARELLLSIDRPPGQIRFDLCIVQFQESSGYTRSIDAEAHYTDSTVQSWNDSSTLSAGFDDLLSLQFDLISALGYRAALALTGEISANTASLLTNTSLRALDGETVHLENLGTFRYRDRDPDTEDEELGVTREIDSGLTIDITGTIHHDRSISIAVAVSISKQGVDTTAAGNPPPTSRKVIETVVRVDHGEPLIVGGLLQEEQDESDRRIPILGRIPLIGGILGNRSRRSERSELVLYLSAFVEPVLSAEAREEEQTAALRRLIGDSR